MILSQDEMKVIADALKVALDKYSEDVKDAIHSYSLNTGELIKKKASVENLLERLGTRFD